MMTEDNWYASVNDEQMGPLSFESLRQMAAEARLTADDLVWEEGTPNWVPAAQVPTLCAAAGWGDPRVPALPTPPRASFGEQYRPQIQSLGHRVGLLDRTEAAIETLPHLRFVHQRLAELKQQVTIHQLDALDRWAKRIGTLAYMLTAVLYAGFFATTSLRADSIQQFLLTLLLVIPGASLCHYIAIHFIESAEDLLGRTPTELASQNFPTSLGLLAGVSGLAGVSMASYNLFRKVDVYESLVLLAPVLLLLYGAAVCFVPSSTNTGLGSRAGAPREAIGISMFLAKLPLRLVPTTFALASILAAASAGFFCWHLAKGTNLFEFASEVAPRALLVGLLPAGLYLSSILLILLIDTFRASLDMSDGVQDLADVLKRAQEPG